MYVFTNGKLLGGPIKNLYDFVEENGAIELGSDRAFDSVAASRINQPTKLSAASASMTFSLKSAVDISKYGNTIISSDQLHVLASVSRNEQQSGCTKGHSTMRLSASRTLSPRDSPRVHDTGIHAAGARTPPGS
jgi:hypothetical protein